MTLMERSILGQLSLLALASGSAMLFLVAFVKAAALMVAFAAGDFSWSAFGELLLYSLPDQAALLLPLVTYGCILWTYARLLDDRELIALSIAGISPAGLARPAVWFALAMMLLTAVTTFWLVPLSFGLFKDREHEIRSGLATALLEPGRVNPVGGDLAVYFRASDAAGALAGVILYDARDPLTRKTVVASRALMQRSGDALVFVLEDGSIQEQADGQPVPRIVVFDNLTVNLDAASLGFRPRSARGVNERPLGELLFGQPGPHEPEMRPVMRAHGHHQLSTPLLCLSLAGAALWLVLAPPAGRRAPPWWRWPAALALGAASQWLIVAAASLAESDNSLLAAIWLAVLLPGLVGWRALLKRPRPRRRGSAGPRQPAALAAKRAGS